MAVIHGGPGAPGYMAPVARELCGICSVLEPLQTATSLSGQIHELKEILDKNASPPVILIGSSWGAMLCYIFTAYHPAYVKKLILIGSAAFEQKYEQNIMSVRLNRLNAEERKIACYLREQLDNPDVRDKDSLFLKLAQLFIKSDSYDPITMNIELIEAQYELFRSVWCDAVKQRENAKLLLLGKQIQCPVVAIHGDYDPHPAEGVWKPLSKVLNNFHYFILENCGHYPWIERQAKDQFYVRLKDQILN